MDQLYEHEDHPIQEPLYKFMLTELLEVAFRNMPRLKQCEAYVMIKGAADAHQLARMQDNPIRPPSQYLYGKA